MGERLRDGLAEPTGLLSGLAVASAAKIPPLVREGGGVGGGARLRQTTIVWGLIRGFQEGSV